MREEITHGREEVMQHHDITVEPQSQQAPPARPFAGPKRNPPSQVYRDSAYGGAAMTAAIEDGLLVEEVDAILLGRSVVQAFPVLWDESPLEYASRAVSEMMVAYLR
jgi:hypothetical protein